MARFKRETPEQEAARMQAIADKKAVLDAAISAAESQRLSPGHSGKQLSEAMLAVAQQGLQDMGADLFEHQIRTKVAPPKDPSTYTCQNTGLKEPCSAGIPKQQNSRCDLCGKIRNGI